GHPPWSASAQPGPDGGTVRAATEADLERVIGQFAAAAARSHAAGFAGVELHGAHGYLLSQFLSTTMNLRDDRWGGAFENRARLVREATRAARAATPSGFLVGVRLSPEDYGNARGLDLDESLELAARLADDGADFVHVSLWNARNPTQKRPDQHPVPLFRAALPRDVALVVAGEVWTRADADALLEKGADAVALGRSAIANPDWPARVADPAWQPCRLPLSVDELHARGLSPRFTGYMRNWKGFVAD
ncbi:MAG TPA: tRNA-dihydrouridine synthase, partial [Polyangiaceae bacterium]|nr:tRNA-dihydrouridine synthase [Polyangiaceae bacterium]